MEQEQNQNTVSKPDIRTNMVESFDHFRIGMDKLANVYPLMEKVDRELYETVGKIGSTMTKLMEGYSKLIEDWGGTIEPATKKDGIEQLFGSKGLNSLGLNENKYEVFQTRYENDVDRINDIMTQTNK